MSKSESKNEKNAMFHASDFHKKHAHAHAYTRTRTHARMCAWDMGYFFAATPKTLLVLFFNCLAERLPWGLQKNIF